VNVNPHTSGVGPQLRGSVQRQLILKFANVLQLVEQTSVKRRDGEAMGDLLDFPGAVMDNFAVNIWRKWCLLIKLALLAVSPHPSL
jgi:hypothetical protein